MLVGERANILRPVNFRRWASARPCALWLQPCDCITITEVPYLCVHGFLATNFFSQQDVMDLSKLQHYKLEGKSQVPLVRDTAAIQ